MYARFRTLRVGNRVRSTLRYVFSEKLGLEVLENVRFKWRL